MAPAAAPASWLGLRSESFAGPGGGGSVEEWGAAMGSSPLVYVAAGREEVGLWDVAGGFISSLFIFDLI